MEEPKPIIPEPKAEDKEPIIKKAGRPKKEKKNGQKKVWSGI